ncbi:MAG TPA: hypothetical protein VGI43_14780 [Mucilaginibacter sp.]
MKKLPLLLIILSGIKLFACAQDNHTLKVDLGINGFPGGTLRSAGLTLELQELTPAKLVFGVRGQLIYAGQGHDYLPVCVTADYHFSGTEPEKDFKIFAGGGAGVYAQATRTTLKALKQRLISGSFRGRGSSLGISVFQSNIIIRAAKSIMRVSAWVIFLELVDNCRTSQQKISCKHTFTT